jgi:uncharacterized membrane protein SpoIIM required for sporulation
MSAAYTNAALLLVSTFTLVFCLGLQSQLVNNGHFVGAFVNSLAIGSANLVLFKLAPTASGIEIAGYLLGGPFGIVCSMTAYRWMRRHINHLPTRSQP